MTGLRPSHVIPEEKLPGLPSGGALPSERSDLLSCSHPCLASRPAPAPAGTFQSRSVSPRATAPTAPSCGRPSPAPSADHSAAPSRSPGTVAVLAQLLRPARARRRHDLRRPGDRCRAPRAAPTGKPKSPQPSGALRTALTAVLGSTRKPSPCRPALPPRP